MEDLKDAENVDAVELVTKQTIRQQVWDYLEKNNLAAYPRPVNGRIPNFKLCEKAAENLIELDEFKGAQNIKVNPDKPQSSARALVLEKGKNLYVPIPRLVSGLIKHVMLPENTSVSDIKTVVNQKGIQEFGKDVLLTDKINIDLIILGSVAVSKQGYRVGKGKGYADLEFGILSQMKAVNQNTVVITTVHDSQVFDTLPEHIFGPHDVPVDIIVTPTQIYRIENRLPKPEGIIWNLISVQKLKLIPVLQLLRELDEKEGKDVTLSEINEDIKIFRGRRRRNNNNSRIRRKSEAKVSESTEKDPTENNNIKVAPRKNRKLRYPKNNVDNAEKENAGTENNVRRRPKKNFRKAFALTDFSLMVRNIESHIRIREFKAALAERGIKPKIIMWHGVKGYCCLHFAKNGARSIKNSAEANGANVSDSEDTLAVDSVINVLQSIKLNPETDSTLQVEVMKPISRIETTDVSTV